MSYREGTFTFACNGESLVGVAAQPAASATDVGVLIVVGGPQYRTGSHRQFVLLARHLAEQGVACMRFDCRGMGDSTGSPQPFDALHDDIRAATDVFLTRAPQVRRIVLWGLCDGASAACLYAPEDPRVVGLILVNPWVRTESGAARTYLKHYYSRRLFDRAFWTKLVDGRVDIGKSLLGLSATLRKSRRGSGDAGPQACARQAAALPDRMASAVQMAGRPVCMILSENDYVADEFRQILREHAGWRRIGESAGLITVAGANHTFSRAAWRDQVAMASSRWVLEGCPQE